jgi:hypothetical protein
VTQEQQGLYDKLLAHAKELTAAAEKLRTTTKPGPTVRQVYGVSRAELVAPKGYRLAEFRVISPNETVVFLGAPEIPSTNYIPFVCTSGIGPYSGEDAWRIVLEPLEAPTVEKVYGRPRSEIEVPEGFRLGEFRKVQGQVGVQFLPGGGGRVSDGVYTATKDWPDYDGGWRIVMEPIPVPPPEPPKPTIEFVYGKSKAEIVAKLPKGKALTGEFWEPQKYEDFVTQDPGHDIMHCYCSDTGYGPRLIVKDISNEPAPPKGFEWVRDENGDRAREPKQGEWCVMNDDDYPCVSCNDHNETARGVDPCLFFRLRKLPGPPKLQRVVEVYRLVTYVGPEDEVRVLVASAPDLEGERAGEVRISRREIGLPAGLTERMDTRDESWEELEAN